MYIFFPTLHNKSRCKDTIFFNYMAVVRFFFIFQIYGLTLNIL